MEMRAAPHRRLVGRRDAAIFGVLTIVPLVLGGRGRLNADTKQYLYLDPGELLERARSLWDPALGGGTVSHQAIGYLWPMGPYYWTMDTVGVPDWVAQRIWIGAIQFVAALGVLAFLRHVMPRHPAQLVGAALYGLSPFVLGHVTGQSGLLLPFAALGWLALCVSLAIERGGWRWPAAFALVVTTCGSLNGSSTFFVLLGAVLWVPHAVFVAKRCSVRSGVIVVAKLGALTLVTQLWWLVAYAIGGRYGLPILAVTENVRTTSGTTSSIEILRGLGYWFFYGRDKLGPWLDELAPPYIELPVLVATFALPIVALLLGGILRWTHRVYFGGLVLVGMLVSIGAFPEPGSPFGSAFESISRSSDLVLSLRNTQRAAPLVVLGLAGLTAAGGAALQRRHARTGAAVLVALALLVGFSLPAQWRDGLIASRFHREDVPAAWSDAGRHLDARGGGRVLELPGIDFASYRWGHTLDPVLTGLTDRDVLFRELVPAGGPAGASLLAAFDSALQEYTLEPAAIAPVARLFGIEDVVFRGDLEYERYRTVRPEVAWDLLSDEATGLGERTAFVDAYRNDAVDTRPMIDEIELGMPPGVETPPQAAVLHVPDGRRAIVTTRPAASATVLAGDGEGVVAAAAAGLIDGRRESGPLLLAGTVHPALAGPSGSHDVRHIVTDTNRKRAGRWYSLRENVGATEPADRGVVLDDPSDARLDVTAGRGIDDRTVAEWRGADRIWANSYGNPFTLLPEDRPSNAFDGDRRTSWRLDMISRDDLPLLGITLSEPSRASEITLAPVTNRPGTTAPVRVRVTLDGARRFEALAVNAPEDLVVELDGAPFTTLVVEVLEWTGGGGPVGIADVVIPGVTVSEMLRLPTATLARLGAGTADAPLAIVMSRHRANPSEVVRRDPEPRLARTFALAGDAAFVLRGTARLAPSAPDDVIDRLLGLGGGVTTRSSEHLAGALDARSASAFDGDPSTSWTTPFVGLVDQFVEIDAGSTLTVDRFDVRSVVDERHSTVTALRVSVDGGAATDVAVDPDGETSVVLPAPLTGRVFRFTVASVTERQVTDWYTERPVALPVALSEISLPGAAPRRQPPSIDTGCRTDLLTVDGAAVGVRLTGSAADALARKPLTLATCDAGALDLAAGAHDVLTAQGIDTGIDIDRLVLETPAWRTSGPAPSKATPEVTMESTSTTRTSGSLAADGRPFWVVLDQSVNEGWRLRVDGASVDGPHPVDSYAAGWLVTPQRTGQLDFTVEWAPQRTVDLALGVSALAVAGCGALLVVGRGRRRSAGRDEAGRPPLVDAPSIGWSRLDRRAPLGAAIVIVAGATLVAGVFVHPLAAPAAAALAVAALAAPIVGRLLPAALVAAAAVLVVLEQARNDHRLDGEWPQWFGAAHVAAMFGVILLAVTVAAGALRRPTKHVEH